MKVFLLFSFFFAAGTNLWLKSICIHFFTHALIIISFVQTEMMHICTYFKYRNKITIIFNC